VKHFTNMQRYWMKPVIAGVVFFAVAQGVLLAAACYAGTQTAVLKPADILSLLTGTLTAMGLTAIFASFQQANREAALRLDELYVAFNSADMQRHRDLAWTYLDKLLEVKKVKGHPKYWREDHINAFSHWWVNSAGNAPSGRELEIDDPASTNDYTWAVTAMITFYVRLENHFATHFPEGQPGSSEFERATGPFVWNYWADRLLDLAEACSEVHVLPERHGRQIKPYFETPLQALEARYHGKTTPHDRRKKNNRPLLAPSAGGSSTRGFTTPVAR
jgi:hypothetical protein